MQRPLQNLLAVFILLGAIAWWITGRVAVSHSVRDFFIGEEEAAKPPEDSPGDQENALIEKALAGLPRPPAEHSPEVADLIARLAELQTIPAILVNAVKRDRDTPKDETPAAWSEAELEALKNYQEKFGEAWEPFLSGPQPDWEKFPDSAIFFRSHFPLVDKEYKDLLRYGFYQAGQPGNWEQPLGGHPDFLLRLLRQSTSLGTLRYGSFSGWGVTDSVYLTSWATKVFQESGYFFPPPSADPKELLLLTPPPPTIKTLREGLKTDRAVFLRTAEYLESLPAETPAGMALTRLLGNKFDADWFLTHVDGPKTTRALATTIRQGAEQIALLEQRTYLSGAAWRQWVAGTPDQDLAPSLRGALDGCKEFEKTQMEYQVALAFTKAAIAFQENGLEGIRKISDPARPGSYLVITTSTNGTTLSSAYQKKPGESLSVSLETAPSP